MDLPEFFAGFVRWASGQPDVHAVALVGSHARGEVTDSSDVDLVVLVQDPKVYLGNTTWASRFGAVRRQETEEYGPLTSLRVFYEDGPEVEYGIADPA